MGELVDVSDRWGVFYKFHGKDVSYKRVKIHRPYLARRKDPDLFHSSWTVPIFGFGLVRSGFFVGSHVTFGRSSGTID